MVCDQELRFCRSSPLDILRQIGEHLAMPSPYLGHCLQSSWWQHLKLSLDMRYIAKEKTGWVKNTHGFAFLLPLGNLVSDSC